MLALTTTLAAPVGDDLLGHPGWKWHLEQRSRSFADTPDHRGRLFQRGLLGTVVVGAASGSRLGVARRGSRPKDVCLFWLSAWLAPSSLPRSSWVASISGSRGSSCSSSGSRAQQPGLSRRAGGPRAADKSRRCRPAWRRRARRCRRQVVRSAGSWCRCPPWACRSTRRCRSGTRRWSRTSPAGPTRVETSPRPSRPPGRGTSAEKESGSQHTRRCSTVLLAGLVVNAGVVLDEPRPGVVACTRGAKESGSRLVAGAGPCRPSRSRAAVDFSNQVLATATCHVEARWTSSCRPSRAGPRDPCLLVAHARAAAGRSGTSW